MILSLAKTKNTKGLQRQSRVQNTPSIVSQSTGFVRKIPLNPTNNETLQIYAFRVSFVSFSVPLIVFKFRDLYGEPDPAEK